MVTNLPNHNNESLLLTQAEAAHYLHVEPRTLEAWRQRRIGPRFVNYSKRCVRYRLADLESFVASRTVPISDQHAEAA